MSCLELLICNDIMIPILSRSSFSSATFGRFVQFLSNYDLFDKLVKEYLGI